MKRRRIELSLGTKIKLIEDSETLPKPLQKDLAEKYNISKQTVSDILKKKDEYKAQFETNIAADRKRLNKGKYEDINRVLHEWFVCAQTKSIPLSGPILKEKAMQFAVDLKIEDFKASEGWLTSWKPKWLTYQ